MFNALTARGNVVLSLIIFLAVCVAGYFAYQYFHSAQLVTGESQQQAETPQGINLAAHNAHVGIMQDQLNEAARQIALLKNKQPDTIIKTVPVEVEKVIEKEVAVRGADFGIVTDLKNPNKVVDLKEVGKLPASTDVTLNQYNVFAYKKVLHDVIVYPSFNGITPNGISELDYGVSRKISKDGKYLGIVGGYEFDDKKAKIGLRLTF